MALWTLKILRTVSKGKAIRRNPTNFCVLSSVVVFLFYSTELEREREGEKKVEMFVRKVLSFE